jgi:hypothetical protein
MTDDRKPDDEVPSDDEVARARELILRRRSRMMTAAMASLGMIGTSCSKSSVCLSLAPPDEDVNTQPDSGFPTVCLGALPDDAGSFDAGTDAGPSVCLEPLFDAGDDAGPRVCLDIAVPEDAGADGGDGSVPDASPTVCLGALPDDDELSDEPDPPVAG